MSLIEVAHEVLQILNAGHYSAPSGRQVAIAAAQAAAEAGTRLYTPAELNALLAEAPRPAAEPPPTIRVTDETTQVAAHRMAAEGPIAVLNFASARNPGGGFLGGARAQEEDVCRCSGLYPTLAPQTAYYQANRAQASLLYTDHLIWSPEVPFFRVALPALLEVPFLASVLTAPAPNAGEALQRDAAAGPQIEATLRRRVGQVLAVAAAQGVRRLVLGAWGCGVFRNDPVVAADAFAQWLAHPRFAGAFDEITFAVYDPRPPRANLAAFRARFES